MFGRGEADPLPPTLSANPAPTPIPHSHTPPNAVEGTLAVTLRDEARLLKQVGVDSSAGDRPVRFDEQPHKLAEAGRVVVVGGARVTEGLVVVVVVVEVVVVVTTSTYSTCTCACSCAVLASKTTLDCSTQRETSESCTSSSSAETRRVGVFDSGRCPARQHRYCMMCLLASVLPAPETPETTIAWLAAVRQRLRYDCSATAYRCGGQAAGRRSTYCFIVSTE